MKNRTLPNREGAILHTKKLFLYPNTFDKTAQ